ncbi:hypothetical protein SAMD00019534_010280 [Acytostelium subglobosum LB1]|uniref:hypothetical protein n=1 Tax=Acytostelium subglobosum LB1 TaxID=1410327 RepID=UPI000644C6ED|nr:hypothetical protein SAMD00019534_010280 [Acytostelium subglobosum LB1]GAM17853.1 hypothetical protein SAMD00019534_010280 [Acytostelium subglobosum LB1]|eukprot:XP_012758449.1 hypothetical protein SAMD00019534_010280 [Acytostelium subglobosum LB1]
MYLMKEAHVKDKQHSKMVHTIYNWILQKRRGKIGAVLEDFVRYYIAQRDNDMLVVCFETYSWCGPTPLLNDTMLEDVSDYIFETKDALLLKSLNRADVAQHLLVRAFERGGTRLQWVKDCVGQNHLSSVLHTLIVYNQTMAKDTLPANKVKTRRHEELFQWLRIMLWKQPTEDYALRAAHDPRRHWLSKVISTFLKLDSYQLALDWYARGVNMLAFANYAPFAVYHKLRNQDGMAEHWMLIGGPSFNEEACNRASSSYLTELMDPLLKGDDMKRLASMRQGGQLAIDADTALDMYLEDNDVEAIIDLLKRHYFVTKELPRDQLIIKCALAIYNSVPDLYGEFLRIVPPALSPVFINPRFFSHAIQNDLALGVRGLENLTPLQSKAMEDSWDTPLNDIIINLVLSNRFSLLVRILDTRPKLHISSLNTIGSCLLANLHQPAVQGLVDTILSLLPAKSLSTPHTNLIIKMHMERGEDAMAVEVFHTMQGPKDLLTYRLSAQLLLRSLVPNELLTLDRLDTFYGIVRGRPLPTNDLTQTDYATVFEECAKKKQNAVIREYYERALRRESTVFRVHKDNIDQHLILLILQSLDSAGARCRLFRSLFDVKRMTSITPKIYGMLKRDNNTVRDPHLSAILRTYPPKSIPPSQQRPTPPDEPVVSQLSEDKIISFLSSRLNIHVK